MAVKRSCGADGFQSFSVHQSKKSILLNGSKRAATLIAAATAGLYSVSAQAQLAPGIYIEQIGDGTIPANSVSDSTPNQQPLFVDSLAPGASTLSNGTISLPTTNTFSSATRGAISDIADEGGPTSLTGFSHGMMQATPDGRYLITVGYDLATGAVTSQHTIAVIDSATSGVNSGSYTAVTTSNMAPTPLRSVASIDGGKHVWVEGGSGTGLRYISPPNSFQSPATPLQRTVSVFNNQLFVDGGATATGTGPGIAVVGSGLPTVGPNTETYVINTGTNPEQFVMLDQDPSLGFNNNVSGNAQLTNLDVCYVATDNGMEKYVLNNDNTTWTKTETIAPTTGLDAKITTQLVGLTYAGKDDAGHNVLYATTAGSYGQTGVGGSSTQGNALMRLVDNGTSAQWQLVQESTTHSWLRGLAVVKQAGDTNGDFHVDSTDFGVLAANFGKTGVTDGFASGDFNYDGIVNALDFNALATNFGYDPNSVLTPGPGAIADAAPLGSVVPEPASISLLLLGTLALTGRRRMARSV